MNFSVNIAGIDLINPIILASGTAGYGLELKKIDGFNLNEVGAICLKGISLKPRKGNPLTRVTETPAGVLNSIGLENIGVERLINGVLPELSGLETRIIVNIFAEKEEEFSELAKVLRPFTQISFLEVNVSCPNVERGGISFGTDAEAVRSIVRFVKEADPDHPVIVKLTPNVTDLREIALACYHGGADAVSMINTLQGMVIDMESYPPRPVLANNYGGLSGPAIRPVALAAVSRTYRYFRIRRIKIPIIGMGGIWSADDAVQFMVAGANAVGLGTVNFHNPLVYKDILRGLAHYLQTISSKDINSIVGTLTLND